MDTPEVDQQTTSSAPPSSSRPVGRRLLLWLLGLFFLGVTTLVVLHLSWRSRVADELERVVLELDENEPGWRLADLEAARPVPPASENSAIVAQNVARLLPNPWPPEGFESLPQDVEPPRLLDAAVADALRAERDRLKLALTEARKIAQMPDGHFPLRLARGAVSTLLGPEAETRRIATLLQCDAVVCCQDGDLTGACRACRALRNLARSVDNEPFSICQLIVVAEITMLCRSLERVLAQGELGHDELESLQHLLEEEAAVPHLEIMARGERATWHEAFDAIEAREMPNPQLFFKSDVSSWKERWMPSVLQAEVREQHVEMLALMAEFMDCVRRPEPDRSGALKAFERRIASMPTGLARDPFPSLIKVVDAIRRSDVYLRCTACALATERYRNHHRKWPDTLAALVPTYLSAVPLDPFDGAPLRYRKTADGVIIYSVSTDGVDNGGNIDHANPSATGKDLGIRLWDPAQRRQPPAKGGKIKKPGPP
jgi:hypothetical protein